MCLIIYANVLHLLVPKPNDDFEPVFEALATRKAVAVHGGRLTHEYLELKRLRGIIREFDRQAIFRKVPDSEVGQMTARVRREGLYVSDDPHIIALARVSGVRLLCSHDHDLHGDFTNPRILRPPGSVYQNRRHRHLIRRHCASGGCSLPA